MRFYFVVLNMPGLKDSDSNIIISQWYGVDHIMCFNYSTKLYSETILASLYRQTLVLLNGAWYASQKMSSDKATR